MASNNTGTTTDSENAKRKIDFKEIPLDGVVLGVPKTRPLQGGPHDAQWALFMIATCGLQMSHERIIAVV